MLYGPGSPQQIYPAPGVQALTWSQRGYGQTFILPRDGTITDIGFYYVSKFGTPNTHTVSIQTTADNGSDERIPTGTSYGGSVDATWNTPAEATSYGWKWITLGTPATAVKDDIVAATLFNDGPGTSYYARIALHDVGEGYDESATGSLVRAVRYSSGAWHSSFYYPRLSGFALRYSDGFIVGLPVVSDVGSVAFHVNSSPDEYGAVFTVPFSCTVSAIFWSFPNTLYDGTLKLYDSADNVLASWSVVYANLQLIQEATIPITPTSLAGGETYRVTWTPSTTNTRYFSVIPLQDAAYRYVLPNGLDFALTSRTDGGAWTDDPTIVPYMGLFLDTITIPFDGIGVGAIALVKPSRYSEQLRIGGVTYTFLDGQICRDLDDADITAGLKWRVVISWEGISQAEYDSLETAWATIRAGPATYQSPDNRAGIASVDKENGQLSWDHWTDGGGIGRYDVAGTFMVVYD